MPARCKARAVPYISGLTTKGGELFRLILFAALVAVPIAEIAVFLLVGGAIGALPTIGLIVLTAIIGTVLLRRQGTAAFARLQDDIRANRVPAAAIGHALTVAVAGVLLLTPGFITDAVGFLLFIPAVRAGLWRQIRNSIKIHRLEPEGPTYRQSEPQRRGSRTIDLDEGEYRPSDPTSPWGGSDR